MRRRVVHVTTAHLADDVRIFERECRSLAASGLYDVFLAAAGSLPVDSGVTLIPLTPAPVSRAGRFSSGPRKALALSRAVSADLWHFHDPELLPVALRLSRSGVPVIWDAHEDYIAQFTDDGAKSWVPGPARGLVRITLESVLKAVDRGAVGVVAATPTIAARYTNPNTVVVGNEARLEDFASCSPSFDARRCLFIGIPGHGHLFLEVVEAIRGLPGVRLAVAGHEPEPTIWRQARAALGDRIEHLGWLSRQGLAREITSSTIGLATDAPIPAYLDEGASPTKVFEFLAGGLPIVGTPTPSVAKLLSESAGGTLSKGYSSGDLRDSIAQTMQGREEWMALSQAGRSWIYQNAGWGPSESRLLALYSAALGD